MTLKRINIRLRPDQAARMDAVEQHLPSMKQSDLIRLIIDKGLDFYLPNWPTNRPIDVTTDRSPDAE